MQTVGAVFPYTIMINIDDGQISGKNDRKDYADRYGEKQNFPFET
jgi:hypothetical protein